MRTYQLKFVLESAVERALGSSLPANAAQRQDNLVGRNVAKRRPTANAAPAAYASSMMPF